MFGLRATPGSGQGRDSLWGKAWVEGLSGLVQTDFTPAAAGVDLEGSATGLVWMVWVALVGWE